MAITNAMPTSFKAELLQALHNFSLTGGNTFKLALYTSSATLGAATTVYTTTNEVTGTNYTAGGNTLTRIDPTTGGTTGFTDFADLVFTNVTLTANGAMIYNVTNGNRASAILAFGADKTATAGDFTVIFPAAADTTAIIRIA
jgi:hypothetical protein